MMDVAQLTPIAQDYLKVIWQAVEWGDPPITTKGLAARLGTTQANVSETVKRLAAQGLLTHEPYKPVVLTDVGEHLARLMVRRHRLIETFLTEVLGYGWEEVHDDAELLEHAVSDRFVTRLDALLGHPAHDPHGDPIPDATGAWSRTDAPRLAEVEAGEYEVVRVSDADPGRLARLGAAGVVPGAVIRLDDDRVAHGPDGVLHRDDLTAVRARRRR